ncbi:hypothetical protein BUALT_Bualt04G0038300 [Buddleja alternifolia]|uniref:Tf2-1-like SH3-like domain-containing protein n=1 Tax=Buddleja alternifolia TaxID=168488 RepID=A0AAV6XMI0_9LAMI|nr:hypothetical protein BUALT_Bualt04G0038300 [Buddleja alternifolia]
MTNHTTGKTLFEVVYQQPPQHTLDLIPLPKLPRYSVTTEHMETRIDEVQAKVARNIDASNAKYKHAADDKKRRSKVFMEGDPVMIHLRKEQFPASTYNKLKPKKIELCKILKKINVNTYVVDLPDDDEDVLNMCRLHKRLKLPIDDMMAVPNSEPNELRGEKNYTGRKRTREMMSDGGIPERSCRETSC